MPFNSWTYEKHLDNELGNWSTIIEILVLIFCFIVIPIIALGI